MYSQLEEEIEHRKQIQKFRDLGWVPDPPDAPPPLEGNKKGGGSTKHAWEVVPSMHGGVASMQAGR